MASAQEHRQAGNPITTEQTLLAACRRMYRCSDTASLVSTLLELYCEHNLCDAVALYLTDAQQPDTLYLRGSRGTPVDHLPLRIAYVDANLITTYWPALDATSHAFVQPLKQQTDVLGLITGISQQAPAAWSDLDPLVEDAGYVLQQLQRNNPQRIDSTAIRAISAVSAVSNLTLLPPLATERLIHALLLQLLDTLPLQGAAIWLADERNILEDEPDVVQKLSDQHPIKAEILWHQPLRGALFQLAQSIHQGYESVSMISCDDATPAEIVAALRQLGAGGLLTASLRTVGRSIGVLQLALLHQERPPGVVEAALVRALAAQIAVAIENAQVLTRTRADQERTSAVVDATNDAILMLDEHRRVMVINRRARFFFGLSEHELIGKDYDQFSAIFGRIFEEGRQFNNWLRQLLRSDRERAVEEFHTTGSDSRLLQCFSAPVVDRHDHLLGRLLVFRDVTREREVERLKSEFVSTVSHELRTPLSSIQGALQLVLGNPHLQRPGLADNLPPRAHSLLTISLNNTARLIRLINDILDVAKIEQGRVTLQRDAVEAERLCRSACDEVAALSGEREITIDVRVAPNLPPVFADYDRAVQVLVNLLSNAIKFSANSQRVEVRASRDGNYVCFAVQDWGRGIAQLDQARLFQKFQQVDSSSTRETGGTGLGLAISRALVEEHGGRIWLESEEQQGSTFSFSLPIANDPATHSASGQHVLLCVPDGALQETLAAGFQQAGINVVSVDPAHIALRLQNAQPDLLLAGDIPGDPTRLEFLRKLRNETRNHGVPLVLISDRIETSADIKVLPQASTAQLIEETIHKALEVYRPLVLVVDDDPNVRPVIARLLLRHGMRVRQAADGYEGLEIAARLRPDVILLDVMMPGIDGYEVLRRLRADPSTADVAVIILSANDLSDQSPQAVPELRIADHLEKPISAERLTNSISRVIAGSRNA